MTKASWKHITIISKVNVTAAIGNKPALTHNIGRQLTENGVFKGNTGG